MIGTCSDLGTILTCADETDEDEELKKIQQTEDKIQQAHLIREEITEVD